ncbi:hypothetical protein C8R43DRAFT_1137202 [Mycena crocata]|nr:hypothetical protein C8R43DRAFT_1137202 [Mycena crocata]
MPDSTQFKIKTCACSSVAPQPNGTGSTRKARVAWDVSPTVTHGLAAQSAANFCLINYFFWSSTKAFDALSYVLIPAAPLRRPQKNSCVFRHPANRATCSRYVHSIHAPTFLHTEEFGSRFLTEFRSRRATMLMLTISNVGGAARRPEILFNISVFPRAASILERAACLGAAEARSADVQLYSTFHQNVMFLHGAERRTDLLFDISTSAD